MTLNNHENNRNRELIVRQIESVIRRSKTYPLDHPAQLGITRKLHELYVELHRTV